MRMEKLNVILKLKNKKSQRVFASSSHVQILSNNQNVLTYDEQVIRAEIFQALKCIESNLSFASSNGDNQRFKLISPDSKIARNCSQHKTKMKYNIQFGIAPYLKEILIKDLKGQPFSFKFDERTTSQVKKQYDVYVQYYSKVLKLITTSFCGSLFVGHCSEEDMLEHFLQFIRRLDLNTTFFIHLGMDGPSVNKSFEKKLIGRLEKEYQTTFPTLGSCTLHIVHDAFKKGITELSIDIDQFACDLHFFFKCSSARREDYKNMQEVTDVVAWYTLLNKVMYYHKSNS